MIKHRERSGASDLLRFGRTFLSYSRHRALLALLFLLLASATEGISILMLVPVLRLLGLSGEATGVIEVPSFSVAGIAVPSLRLGLVAVLGILVTLILIRALFLRFRGIYTNRVLTDFVNGIRVRAFDSLAGARWSFIAKGRLADYQHILTVEISRVDQSSVLILTIAQDCILAAIYLLISAWVSPTMTGLAMVSAGLVLLLLRPLRHRAGALGKVMTQNNRLLSRTVIELLSGMKVAKSFGAEHRYVEDFASTLKRMLADRIAYVKIGSIASTLFQVSAAVTLSVFIFVSINYLDLSVPSLLVLVLIFSRLAPLFPQIQRSFQQLIFDLPAFELLRDMEMACAEAREPPLPAEPSRIPLNREISFRNISFRYGPEQSADTLKAVSFDIPASRITCLVGPSGSGKSTIADLLLGLIEPDSGEIVIDGVPLTDSNRRAWRAQVAYVPQDTFLLHDTIRANLRVAVSEAGEPDLWSALDAAHAGEFVRRLPEGLDTVVGDRGMRLSGGERQRIALARALLKKPQLLVLDEATSALDWQNQEAIAETLRALRGTVTLVVIGHRLSAVAFADWAVALDDGMVVETGPYQQLAEETGSVLGQIVMAESGRRARE